MSMKFNEDATLYYADHPIEFVKDIIGASPDRGQKKILDSLAKEQMTSVRSGHGVGKSAVEAWAILWFLRTRAFPKVPCTAPTQHQLYDILWAEVSKWMRYMDRLQPGAADGLVWTKERVYSQKYPEEWFAVARTASSPDALQGFHADDVLYIIDEASGVSDEIFESILGALSGDGAKLLMCGNPTQLSGFFYESHNKNRASYNALHIDGRESGRVSKEYVRRIINMYGEDSDVFRVRVAGEFPLAGDNIFIPMPLLEKSIQTEYRELDTPAQIHIGCDVARFGSDKTVITYRTDEKCVIQKKINGQDTMKTVDNIVELGLWLINRYRLTRESSFMIPVKVDDSGVGGGVVDRLKQLKEKDPEAFWWLDLVPVHFGVRIKHHNYYDSTTYMMGVLKNLLMAVDEDGHPKAVEAVLPDDDDLIGQISSRRYTMTDNGRIKVESKKEMKARGLPSPDEADAVLLAYLPVEAKKAKKKRGEK